MRKTILIVLAVCSFCIADEPKAPDRPQSPAAVAALREYDKAEQVAEEACRQAKLAADRRLIEKLKVAIAVATKASNLDEANRINDQIKAAAGRIDELTSPPKQAAPKFTVWDFQWAGGSMRNWLLADGTLINAKGERGTWHRDGRIVTLDHGGPKDILKLSADGKTMAGGILKAAMAGTDMTGAEPPPVK